MALDLDGAVWQSHQWYAVAMGSQAKYHPTQKKITGGQEFKVHMPKSVYYIVLTVLLLFLQHHIDIAVSLNESEPALFHLRGRWFYEVAGISWLERTAAAALYSTPPQATYEDALQDFMMVEQLTPGTWTANLLMVAKVRHMLSSREVLVGVARPHPHILTI